MQFAERMKNLGSETAFAVGAEAAARAKQGQKIYPFHLGDMNIKTPSHIIEAAKKYMDAGKTSYSPTPGMLELREALAEVEGKRRGLQFTAENVSVQPGGKPVIGKFIQVLMNPGDEVFYPNPGYPIYESMIRYYGGKGIPYGYHEHDHGFAIDFDTLEKNVSPKTKIFIYNNYHNPIGAESSPEEMGRIAEFCKKHNLYVLSDEAYFEILYGGVGKSIASLPGMAERTLILYTFAKKYAMTGWRLGAAIGPKEIVEQITRLNCNDESCTNTFIQLAAADALRGPEEPQKEILNVLRERRDVTVEMLNSIPGIKCHNANCTFYLFPNVTEAMAKMGISDVEEFRKKVLENTGVSFTTRKHFGTPLPGETQKYVRFAYSGIDVEQIKEGLAGLKKFIESQ